MAESNIQYFSNLHSGIELILNYHSAIHYPLHNHVSVFIIGIVLEGAVSLTTRQETTVYGENQTFILMPYTPHSLAASDKYSMLNLCIDKNKAQKQTPASLKNDIINLLTKAFHYDTHRLEQILRLLHCQTLFPSLKTLNQTQQASSVFASLKEQLEQYPEQKLCITEMAQSSFVSKYHFIRSFQAEVGLTPHQFQIQNRVRKAQRLICQTNTITEAALTAGFCDQSHFTKQFEKYVGLTPSAYKAACTIVR